jgi:phosphoglycerate dehydrogenase-like enzyme
MRVLIPRRSHGRLAQALSERVPNLEAVLMDDEGTLWLGDETVTLEAAAPVAAWANTDLFIGGPVREFMIACLKSDSLRFIQSSAAGFDHPIFGMLVDKGIALANSDASAIAIAEFVVSSVLDVFQPHALRRELQAERRWQRTPFREVCGTTWVIVGMGNIGTRVAVRARAFGAHVVGVRRTPRGDEPADRMLQPGQLPEVLPDADVVALCLPANADSQHLVDDDFLAALGPDAVLVNIGRGALIDEDALLRGLQRARPATAVLDVFQTEPLPQDSPFWSHPRVRVSAHNAANGDGFTRRNDELFLRNIARYLAGETPENLVDPEVVKTSVQGNR